MGASPKQYYTQILQSIEAEGLYKNERVLQSAQSAHVTINGESYLNLCSNNYLGLSSHPEVIEAAHKGLDSHGFGLSSVRFICGTQDIHLELEARLSQFLGTEKTILFSSCFDANAAVFEALLGPEDVVIADKLIHASLIDGIRLCKAKRLVYAHRNMNELEEHLKSHARHKMVVTDGVFSMDGTLAPLKDIVNLAQKYQAMILLDDSHATGFFGKTGRGTAEHFGISGKIDLITTTFGKALGGAMGGCVSGKAEMIDLIRQRGRPYLFSNALMPAVVCATLKVLDLLSTTERRDALFARTKTWGELLAGAGFTLKSQETPIIPVMVFDAVLAQKMSAELFRQKVLALGFFYPVVPKGEARLRTQMSASLAETDLNQAVEAFVIAGKNCGVI